MYHCPKHPDTPLRKEYSAQGRTGFCSKCLQHYKLCSAAQGTWACEKIDGHQGREHAVFHFDGSAYHTWQDGDAGTHE